MELPLLLLFLASSWFPSLPMMPSRFTELTLCPGPPRGTNSDPKATARPRGQWSPGTSLLDSPTL
ncbi:CKLF like MARVEL transmembrane domain containing 5 [Phyllostomus discolor]|uniref:CKLF like MARVEL transmembrane domain containing 5 n=1 Tax=Phyllostomus discolor TaxID=89673 RepID=A0A834EU45_9CHIR|nr:CKLF like MARVEL transmembrane domain containing 5 [Phyllostomus discolor]